MKESTLQRTKIKLGSFYDTTYTVTYVHAQVENSVIYIHQVTSVYNHYKQMFILHCMHNRNGILNMDGS